MSLLDNKVLDFLPSKFEGLTDRLLTTKTPGGLVYPRWDLGSSNLDRVFGKGDQHMDAALAGLRNFFSANKGGLDEVNAAIRGQSPKVGDANLISSQVAKLIGNKSKKINRQHLSPETAKLLRSFVNHKMIADPNREMGGPSISRFLGHAAQAGVVGTAALTAPYTSKRLKQVRDVKKDTKEKYGKKRRKSASAGQDRDFIGRVLDLMRAGTTEDLYTGKLNPVTSAGPWVIPAGMATLMFAGHGTKKGLLKATDAYSDAQMDKQKRKREAELSRLVRSERRIKSGNFSSGGQGALAALWVALAPLFYGLGKTVGRDTTDAAKVEKLRNALADVERQQAPKIRFRPSEDQDFRTLPGDFMGETTVVMPVGKKQGDKKRSEVFI